MILKIKKIKLIMIIAIIGMFALLFIHTLPYATIYSNNSNHDNKVGIGSSCTINSFTRYRAVSSGESVSISINHSASCMGKTASLTIGGNKQTSVISTNTESSVSFSVSFSGSCGSATSYTVAIDGVTPQTQSGVTIYNAWNERDNFKVRSNPSASSKYAANTGGNTEYGYNCVQEGTGYRCLKYGWRGCSGCTNCDTPSTQPPVVNTPGPTPETTPQITEPEPACYQKSTGEKIWTTDSSVGTKLSLSKSKCKNCYANNVDLTKADRIAYKSSDSKLVDDVYIDRTEKTCILPASINYCDPAPIGKTPSQEVKTASMCEDTISVNYKDGFSCDGSYFYQIKCDENNISVEFDNGNDKGKSNSIGSLTTLLAGQGFKFGIKVKVVRKCKATFDSANWKTAYNKIKAKYDEVVSKLVGATGDDKTTLESWKYDYQNTLTKLKGVVNTYNGYKNATALNPTDDLNGAITVKYKVDGHDKTISTTFEESVDEGHGKVVVGASHNLGISGLTNPVNFTWSNEETPKIIKMALPKVYLDSSTGVVIDPASASEIVKIVDGGNKLYLDFNTDANKNDETYTMEISLTGSGVIKKISNNMCKIKVYEPDLLYRPISLTNPFINSEHNKGENWVNTLFDFTNTIHTNIWSEVPLYDVILYANQIEELKKSNQDHKDDSPYLGLCERQSYNTQDAITRALCDIIN